MKLQKDYNCVNDFAPRDGILSVYFKKLCGKKSDGFAAVFDGRVYLIDVGGKKDGEMLRFLSELRERWLENAPAAVDKKRARLEICIIISHPHPDHVGALPFILSDSRFCVMELLAPERSYRSLPGPDLLPKQAEFEESLYGTLHLLSEYHHVAEKVTNLPYGKVYPIHPAGCDVRLDLYPSPFDWSEDRGNDREGFRYLVRTSGNNSPAYLIDPEKGWVNGALNGNSLWVRIRKGKQTVLITGDQRADDAMLGAMIRYYGEEHFRCDVLKLNHHGTNTFPPYLIQVASPAITVFTVSRELATPETKELCERVSTPYYLGEGNLILTLDGKESLKAEQYE